MAGNPSKVSNNGAFVILFFGAASIILNYISDGQKEAFRDQCYKTFYGSNLQKLVQ
jgi:hypothetical protein